MSNGADHPLNRFSFFHEEPEALGEGPAQEFAQQILEWIIHHRRLGTLSVAGIFGSRGSGKTSVLLQLGRLAMAVGRSAGDTRTPIAVATRQCPTGQRRDWPEPVLFELGRAEPADDLILGLLGHIERHFPNGGSQAALDDVACDHADPSTSSASDPITRAFEALARRAAPNRFLDLAQEETPSIRALPGKLVQVHRRIACTTTTVRAALAEAVRRIRDAAWMTRANSAPADADHHTPLLLLVDDVDVQPEQTLPLLELLHRYLRDCPDVVVVLAADPEVTPDAIRWGLEKRGPKSGSLEWSTLEKLIPLRFELPRWEVAGCLEFLWPLNSTLPVSADPAQTTGPDRPGRLLGVRTPEESVLAQFWPEAGRELLKLLPSMGVVRPLRTQQEAESYTSEDIQASEQEPLPTTVRAWAEGVLAPWLSCSPRRLKALHNRLLRLLWDACQDPPPKACSRSSRNCLACLAKHPRIAGLSLPAGFLAPFCSLIMATEVRFPNLGLWETRLSERVLGNLQPPTVTKANERADRSSEWWRDEAQVLEMLRQAFPPSQSKAVVPILDRLCEPHLSGRRLYYAREQLSHVSKTWDFWNRVASRAPVPEAHLLALSLNADARESSRAAWEGQLPAERIWHIDLRPVLEQAGKLALRIDPAGLQLARQQLATELERQGVPDHQGELWLAGRAQNSLMAWLGWRLNRLRRVRAFNIFGGRITPFEGPAEPLRYREDGLFWKLMPQAVAPAEGEPTGEGEAVVLVDLLGQSTAAQLDWFAGLQTCRQRVRLLGQPPLPPEDLEAGLRDCLELLGQLKHDQGIHTFHLALAAPDVFAFFLGQQLHEFASFRLYELYREPGQAGAYRHVLDLA